jgi:hypothetical protein
LRREKRKDKGRNKIKRVKYTQIGKIKGKIFYVRGVNIGKSLDRKIRSYS